MVVMLSVVDGRDVVMWSHRCASAYQRQDKVTVTTTPSAPLSPTAACNCCCNFQFHCDVLPQPSPPPPPHPLPLHCCRGIAAPECSPCHQSAVYGTRALSMHSQQSKLWLACDCMGLCVTLATFGWSNIFAFSNFAEAFASASSENDCSARYSSVP
jgi:hypothetical protein